MISNVGSVASGTGAGDPVPLDDLERALGANARRRLGIEVSSQIEADFSSRRLLYGRPERLETWEISEFVLDIAVVPDRLLVEQAVLFESVLDISGRMCR